MGMLIPQLIEILRGMRELKIGDALLMMADSFPEVNVEPPDPSHGSAVSLHLEVADCDAVAAAAVQHGAHLDRGPESTSHGRSGGLLRNPSGSGRHFQPGGSANTA